MEGRLGPSRGRVPCGHDQLGHSSIQVTVDYYGHLVPGGNRAAVDKLDDVLGFALPSGNEWKQVASAEPPDPPRSRSQVPVVLEQSEEAGARIRAADLLITNAPQRRSGQ